MFLTVSSEGDPMHGRSGGDHRRDPAKIRVLALMESPGIGS
jgi:hypothetical protein